MDGYGNLRGLILQALRKVLTVTRLTGFGIERVRTSIVVLFAGLVEFGSAFGLFLALLPMRRFPRLGPIAPQRQHTTETAPSS